MENIEELLDFFLVANDETRRNVTGLMKVFHKMVPAVVTVILKISLPFSLNTVSQNTFLNFFLAFFNCFCRRQSVVL